MNIKDRLAICRSFTGQDCNETNLCHLENGEDCICLDCKQDCISCDHGSNFVSVEGVK